MATLTLAIASTFTAEPLADSLSFWFEELGIGADVQFAPTEQVFQQLLDPDSLLGRNRHGVNVVLVRLDDWVAAPTRHGHREPDQGLMATLLAGRPSYQLPNGMRIAHINAYETEYLYREIFRGQGYFAHGITMGEQPCVFDVGANIGLFTFWPSSATLTPAYTRSNLRRRHSTPSASTERWTGRASRSSIADSPVRRESRR